jgi:hypothetical protein
VISPPRIPDPRSLGRPWLATRHRLRVLRHPWLTTLHHLRALRHPWLTTLSAAIAAIAVLYFVVAVSVAELLRPFYDPLRATISELAVGHDGWIQVSAFCVLGVGLLALQHGLWRRLRGTLLSRSGLILLALCAAATFVAAAFPTDLTGSVVHTMSGDIHTWMADVGYSCLILGSLLLSLHFRHDEQWRSYHRPSLALALLGTAAAIAMALTTHSGVLGLTQRLMAVPLLLWILLTALRLFTLPTQGVRSSA